MPSSGSRPVIKQPRLAPRPPRRHSSLPGGRYLVPSGRNWETSSQKAANNPNTNSAPILTRFPRNFIDGLAMSRRLRPDNSHQCYCGMTGIGSGHEQTRGALSHQSEGRGRWLADFPPGDLTSADNKRRQSVFRRFLRQPKNLGVFSNHEPVKSGTIFLELGGLHAT